MRIAWFTQRYHPVVGGAENYGRHMVRRFVADGHEADVYCSDAHDLWYFTDPARGRSESPREEVIDGATVRRLPIRHWFGQKYAGRLLSYAPNWSLRCRYESFMPILPAIRRVRGDYDAVFAVAFPYTLFAHSAFLTARRAGCPLVITPFLHLATPGDKVNRIYTRPHQGRLLREADAVVAVTNLEARAIAGWGVEPSRILTMGMGVEHEAVTGGDPFALRDRLGIPRHRRAIGHLTTLDPNKGTVDLVRAVERLNASRGSEPIHLILAGNSSPQYEAFESTLGPETRRWLTRVQPWEMGMRAEFFAAVDVFSMPSRTDSYGIVFLEAWANGLPVVAAAAGGVAEVVRHGQDGTLVPFGDLEALGSALAAYADDPALARRVGAAGRARVAEGYSWDDRYRTLLARAREVVADRDRPRVDPAHDSVPARSAAKRIRAERLR